MVGRDDSGDVANHDACNAFNRLLRLVVYPRNDRRVRRRRVVIRSVVPGKRATVRLFDDGHVDRVVREQDFADVAEQDVGCRLAPPSRSYGVPRIGSAFANATARQVKR